MERALQQQGHNSNRKRHHSFIREDSRHQSWRLEFSGFPGKFEHVDLNLPESLLLLGSMELFYLPPKFRVANTGLMEYMGHFWERSSV